MANPVAAGLRDLLQPARLSRAGRVERIVAAGRVSLAAFSLAAIWLDPASPARYADATYTLLFVYLVFSVLVLGLVWIAHSVSRRWILANHVVDLATFTVLLSVTEGPASPFFTYFVFAVLAGTLRWQWRGALWTALPAIVAFVAIGAYMSLVLGDPAFELNRFIIRSVYLAVIATLMGYAGFYQELVEGDLARVAAWPRHVSDELESLLAETLREAATILRAPLAAIAFEEPEEPAPRVAWWTAGRFHMERIPSGAHGELVAPELHGRSFLCADLDTEPNRVIVGSPARHDEWLGVAVSPVLRETLAMQSVMSWPLEGETFEARLFAADKLTLMADDLAFGGIVATLVVSRIDHTYLRERLRRASAVEERYRLGADLHDGLLQSLTAIALQLSALSDSLPAGTEPVQQRLRELQAALEAEQRELRMFITELRPGAAAATFDLRSRLADLCTRVERVWPVRVTLRFEGDPGAAGLAIDLYRLMHEALVNAARHSGATGIDAVLRCDRGIANARIADNGRGFPFVGTRTLAALIADDQGPVTLRERVRRLEGDLLIESTPSGSTLTITIPLRTRAPRAAVAARSIPQTGAEGRE